MDLTITSTTPEETSKFELLEWTEVDIEHWGHEIEWEINNFRFKAVDNFGNIVGVIIGKYEAGVTYVDNIIVARKSRGLGVGRKLMQYIEDFTISKFGHKVWLITREEWLPANRLYKRLNYEQTGLLKKHYLEKDFIIYEKLL